VDILTQLAADLVAGDDQAVARLTQQALDTGFEPGQVLQDGLIAGMKRVGELFKNHEIYLPDVLLAAQAMNAGLELLKPFLAHAGVPTRGKIVIGSVQGDLHDIGKNLVGVMLKGAGYEVIDLGNDVPPERFVETAERAGAPLIGMSALLTTTMPVMGQVVTLLRQRGLAGRIKTIVGGAPVNERFAQQIGADAYGYDAANAVERVQALLGH